MMCECGHHATEHAGDRCGYAKDGHLVRDSFWTCMCPGFKRIDTWRDRRKK